jgi:predicted signal transduction protein with EAL and GGDEF domain
VNLDADRTRAAAQAEDVVGKIQSALARLYDLGAGAAGDGADAGEWNCTSSVGVCLFRGHEDGTERLLKYIDVAMYEAKSAGRNRVRFFDPAMQGALEDRAALESDLRRALDGGELRLFYQLQADMTGRRVGAEAPLRWAHPTRGLLPSDFLALAEETRLIAPIGS